MVAALASRLGPHALASLPGERLSRFNAPAALFSVGAGLISRDLQLGNAVLQYRIGEIGNAVFDRIVDPLEFGVRSCSSQASRRPGSRRELDLT